MVSSHVAISKLIPDVAKYRTDHVHAKTAYKQALAKAKIKAMQEATTKSDQLPTMINAYAEIDPIVMAAKNKLDIAECFDTASSLQLAALEEKCLAIKKCMGTLETEMRLFAGE